MIGFLYKIAGTLKFLFNELGRQGGPIARRLHERLEIRIGERRNQDVVSLMKYLTNKDLTATDELPISSKRACHNFAIELFLKSFERGKVAVDVDAASALAEEAAAESTPTTSSASEPSYKEFLSEQLRLAIDREQTVVATKSSSAAGGRSWSSEMEKTLICELAFYDKSNVLGTNLKLLKSALNSIQPTSTECERVFSLSSLFCTKIKSRLSDESLNNLCFLKSYFLRIKNQ